MLFNVRLYGHIDRKCQIASVLCVIIVLEVFEEHICSRAVLESDRSSVLSRQLLVVKEFESFQTVVVLAYESDYVTCQIAVGVVPFRIAFKMHAHKSVIIYESAYPVRLVTLDLLADHLIPGIGILCLFDNVVLVHTEHIGKRPGNKLKILFVELYLMRADEHRVHRRAHSQDFAVPVVNRTSFRSDLRLPGLLANGQCFVVVVLKNLDLEEL